MTLIADAYTKIAESGVLPPPDGVSEKKRSESEVTRLEAYLHASAYTTYNLADIDYRVGHSPRVNRTLIVVALGDLLDQRQA